MYSGILRRRTDVCLVTLLLIFEDVMDIPSHCNVSVTKLRLFFSFGRKCKILKSANASNLLRTYLCTPIHQYSVFIF